MIGNSGTEFKAQAPNPHNSSSTPLVCGAPTPLAATGTATPASVYVNNPTLLTVQVVPGTDPASTGIQVQADLSTIGGSTTQSFFDDGSNGDVKAGDNIFSYSTTTTATGKFSLPVTVTDSQLRTAATTIALTVQQTPPPFVTIRSNPDQQAFDLCDTDGHDERHCDRGEVRWILSGGQGMPYDSGDAGGKSGLHGSLTKLPATIAIGNEVQVTGTVNTYPLTALTPATEIDGPQTFTLLSTGNPLPAPIQITAAMDSP